MEESGLSNTSTVNEQDNLSNVYDFDDFEGSLISSSVYNLSDSDLEDSVDEIESKRSKSKNRKYDSNSSQDSTSTESGVVETKHRTSSLYKQSIEEERSEQRNSEKFESGYVTTRSDVVGIGITLQSSNNVNNNSTEASYQYDSSYSESRKSNYEVDEFEENLDQLDRLVEKNTKSKVIKQFILEQVVDKEILCDNLLDKLKEESISSNNSNNNNNNEVELIRDWNKEFQEIKILKEGKDKYTKLIELTQDFVYCAKIYGKIIIMEVSLPTPQKTIQPVDIGGVAGGLKFHIQGILFKFTRDSKIQEDIWMYGGDESNDEKAMKAALHEFKGVVSIHKLEIKALHLPLVAIIDFRGFRLIASSWLPINKSSLVYGSADGGKTIHNDNKKLYMKMKKACKRLNLKGHWLLDSGIKFYGAGDIEGHVGKDNKFYVVDLARLFPPQAPLAGEKDKRAVFYKLLRPELVRTNPKSLSSDAFSGWGITKKYKYNKHVKQATERLIQQVIPNFVKRLLLIPIATIISETRFLDKMHRHGINARFFGYIRDLIPINNQSKLLRDYLLLELVTRVIKNIIREKLRSKMTELAPPSSTPYKLVVVTFINDILLSHNKQLADNYWKITIKQQIVDKFNGGLSSDELSNNFDLRTTFDLAKVFTLLEQATEIRFDPQVYINLRKQQPFQLTKRDIVKFGVKVRFMNIIDFSEAMILSIEANNKEGIESERLYALSHKKFAEALSKISDDPIALFNWAKVFTQQASKKNGVPRTVDEKIHLLLNGIKRYRACLSIECDFHDCLFWIGVSYCKLAILKKQANETEQYIKEASSKFQRALKQQHDDEYIVLLSRKAEKKYSKSFKCVGYLSEIYKLIAIMMLECILTCKKEGKTIYQLADWLLQYELSRKQIISKPKLMYEKPFQYYKEAITIDNTLLQTFIQDCRQEYESTLQSTVETAEKLFIAISKRLAMLHSMDDKLLIQVLDLNKLQTTNLSTFFKIAPYSLISSFYQNKTILDLTSIALDCSNIVMEKLLDCLSINLTVIKLNYCNLIGENTLHRIAIECIKLEQLIVRGCTNVTSNVVLSLLKLEKLQLLDLSHCFQIRTNAFTNWPTNLTHINLSSCTNITDSTIVLICNVAQNTINYFRIDDCVRVKNIAPISKCTLLLELSINRNKQIIEETIIPIVQQCTKLTVLRMKDCSQIGDLILQYLINSNKTHINSINLYGTNCTERGIYKLISSKGDWIKFRFPKLTSINDSTLKKFYKSSPQLIKVMLPINRLHDSILLKLAKHCPELISLDLRGIEREINSTTINKILRILPKLEKFNISGIHLSSNNNNINNSVSNNNNGMDAEETSALQLSKISKMGVGGGTINQYEIMTPFLSIIIQCKTLSTIDISKTMITNEHCKVIASHCVNLTRINFSFCDSITNEAVEIVITFCTKLSALFLSKCSQITFRCVHFISTVVNSLVSLDLSYCGGFSDQPPLVKLTGLKILKLNHCRWITDVVILAITNGCPSLQSVELENIRISDVSISFLTKRCTEIRSLYLSSNELKITDAAIKKLTKCSKLQVLDITGMTISDISINYFSQNFENMHTLIVLGDESGQKARDRLRQLRPNLIVKTRFL